MLKPNEPVRVVLLTGGSSGIGAATARLLAEAGTATDNAARYALIGKFSKAFADIFEGKKAYRMMYDLTSRLDPLSYYLDADSYTAYYTQLKQIEEA